MKKIIIYSVLVTTFILAAITLFYTAKNLTITEVSTFIEDGLTSIYPESVVTINKSSTSFLGHFSFSFRDIVINSNNDLITIGEIKVVIPLWHIILGKGHIQITVTGYNGIIPTISTATRIKVPGLFRYATSNLDIQNINLNISSKQIFIDKLIIRNINLQAPIVFELQKSKNNLKMLVVGELDLPRLQAKLAAPLKISIRTFKDNVDLDFKTDIDLIIETNKIYTVDTSKSFTLNAKLNTDKGLTLEDLQIKFPIQPLTKLFAKDLLDFNFTNTTLNINGSIDLFPKWSHNLEITSSPFTYLKNDATLKLNSKNLQNEASLTLKAFQGTFLLQLSTDSYINPIFNISLNLKDLVLPNNFKLKKIPLDIVHNGKIKIEATNILYQRRKHQLNINATIIDDLLSIKEANINRQGSTIDFDLIGNLKNKEGNLMVSFHAWNLRFFNLITDMDKYLGGAITGTITGKIAKNFDLILNATIKNGYFYPFKIINTINKENFLNISNKFTNLKILTQLTDKMIVLKEAKTESFGLSGNLYLDNRLSTLYLNVNQIPFRLVGKGTSVKLDTNFTTKPKSE